MSIFSLNQGKIYEYFFNTNLQYFVQIQQWKHQKNVWNRFN